MRKYIAMILALVCLCFTGCGKDAEDPAKDGTELSPNTEETGDADGTAQGFVPVVSEEAETSDRDSVVVGDSGDPVSEGSSFGVTSAEDNVGEVTFETEETAKHEEDKGEDDPVTLPPILQTLPESGVELPDDVWE